MSQMAERMFEDFGSSFGGSFNQKHDNFFGKEFGGNHSSLDGNGGDAMSAHMDSLMQNMRMNMNSDFKGQGGGSSQSME